MEVAASRPTGMRGDPPVEVVVPLVEVVMVSTMA
jgi:hypothetical protein